MRVIIEPDYASLSKWAAAYVARKINESKLAQMQEQGFDTFTEFGPKNVLTGLVKKTLKDVTAKNCENCATLEEVTA